MHLKRWPEWLAPASLVAAMAYFLVELVRTSRIPGGYVAYDIYTFFYPTMIIGAQRVLDGGKGLLWNPFHACGQPFFASGATGLLYPPAILSLVLPPDWALYGVLFFNLTVGSVSAYFLCRELQVGMVAAWCGALAFGLSNSSSELITSTPLVSGPYAWLPGAMLFCERLLREPTLRRAIALAVTIAFALIPGHPQLVLYLYQLIALRVLWELLTRPRAVRARTLGMLALGLALPPLLVAVQFLPTLEVMRAGIRNADLSLNEIGAGYLTWERMRGQIMWRWDIDNPFLLAPWVLASAAFLNLGRRRLVVFYALVGAMALVLALGLNGFLFDLYMQLPFGTLFKYPSRFLWITSFCVAVLVALGVDAVMVAARPGSGWMRRAAIVVVLVAAATGYSFLAPGGLREPDWLPIELAVGAAVTAALLPRLRALAAAAIVVALVVDLLIWRPPPYRRLLPDSAVLFSHAPLFTALRGRLTSQDRVYLAPRHADYALQQKTASLFRVPVLFDYEAQPTRRWAAYFVKMRTGARMTGPVDWGFIFGGWFPSGFKRRLLDLTAARYVVAANEEDRTATLEGAPLRPLTMHGASADVRVYENPTALPRAAWVPRVEVVPDPDALLDRLATGSDDLRQVALVEEPPANFLGDATDPAPSAVEFETDDPEHLVLRVHAPRRGFLFLADQYFSGWHATVDGVETRIQRANYAFRLVEVPAGTSVVEFRYTPLSVAIGALVSSVTVLGVAAALAVAHRRR